MKCPVDGATLTMSERTGIEIDYCPECRGVWLDRGELDKIIDRGVSRNADAAAPQTDPRVAPVPAGPPPTAYSAPAPPIAASYDRHYGGGYGHPRKKRSHWLSEIFD